MGDGPTPHHPAAHPITGADLYGRSGKPHGSDITQGSLGDCFLVSTLGQFAERQPRVITGAIRYDANDQNFAVDLHDVSGRTRTVTVTQADLRMDRRAGVDHSGGVDSPSYWSGTHADGSRPPAWPSVMEVAYAKLHALSPRDTTATDLNTIAGGGWPKDAIHALTGSSETREVTPAQLRDPAKAYDLLRTSIDDGRAILLATNPMKNKPADNLVKGEYYGEHNPKNSGHAYMVEAVEKDRHGHVVLTLRNPWGHNTSPQQGVDSASPIVKVDLQTILDNKHLENLTIGPSLVQTQTAARARHQHDAAKRNAPPGSAAPQTAGRPAGEPAAASGPARADWSDLAAQGRGSTAKPNAAAQAGSQPAADHASAGPAPANPWSHLADEARQATNGARTAAAAAGQGQGRTL